MDSDSRHAPNELRYRIDPEDRIVSVSEEWLLFASENTAPQLDAERVVGRPIYEFIADPETRHLHGAVFEKVRREGEAVRLPFRCDSPALRRCMEITIEQAAPTGTLELSTRLLKLHPRATPLRLLEPHPESPTKMRICSWCERINYRDKSWIDVDEAVVELRLFDTPELPALYPDVCPSCMKNVRGILEHPATEE